MKLFCRQRFFTKNNVFGSFNHAACLRCCTLLNFSLESAKNVSPTTFVVVVVVAVVVVVVVVVVMLPSNV